MCYFLTGGSCFLPVSIRLCFCVSVFVYACVCVCAFLPACDVAVCVSLSLSLFPLFFRCCTQWWGLWSTLPCTPSFPSLSLSLSLSLPLSFFLSLDLLITLSLSLHYSSLLFSSLLFSLLFSSLSPLFSSLSLFSSLLSLSPLFSSLSSSLLSHSSLSQVTSPVCRSVGLRNPQQRSALRGQQKRKSVSEVRTRRFFGFFLPLSRYAALSRSDGRWRWM